MADNASTGPVPYGEFGMHQMALIGIVFNLWAQTEMVIEMVIKEALRLSTVEACIVCGPLGAGAKVEMLKSLMSHRDAKPEFVAAVTQFQSLVGRNALAHGFLTFKNADDPWLIVSREVKNKLTVKSKKVFRYLENDIMPAFEHVLKTSGFNDADMHQYGLEIASLAQDR